MWWRHWRRSSGSWKGTGVDGTRQCEYGRGVDSNPDPSPATIAKRTEELLTPAAWADRLGISGLIEREWQHCPILMVAGRTARSESVAWDSPMTLLDFWTRLWHPLPSGSWPTAKIPRRIRRRRAPVELPADPHIRILEED